MPSPPVVGNQGNLAGISDPIVRGELQKLWHAHQVRSGQLGYGNERFVTLDEFNAVKRQIQLNKPTSQGYRATTLPDESAPRVTTSGGGGGGGGSIYFHYDPPADPTAWVAWWNTEEGALKVWYTPPGDPDSSQWVDAMPARQGPQGTAGANGSNGTSGGTARECCGRLTLLTGTPITTTDQVGKSIVYWTPYNGATMALYNGSAWTIYTSSEISITLSGLTSGKNYDVFAYYTGSAIALELSATWSSDTARTDALTLVDGVLVKSANNTRRYLGTFRTTSTTTTEDSAGGTTSQTGGKRFLWNFYNRIERSASVFDGTASWTYTTAAWRQCNAAAGNKVEIVIGWQDVNVSAVAHALANNTAATGAATGIGLDSTTANAAQLFGTNVFNTAAMTVRADYMGMPSIGYHALNWLEYSFATGTCTWRGQNTNVGVIWQQSGLLVRLAG